MDNVITPYDPFKNFTHENYISKKIIVHVFQRKTRKYITTIKGLEYQNIDIKNFIKYVKKKCSCNGNFNKDNKIIQIQGDQKSEIIQILTEIYNIHNEDIIIRGI